MADLAGDQEVFGPGSERKVGDPEVADGGRVVADQDAPEVGVLLGLDAGESARPPRRWTPGSTPCATLGMACWATFWVIFSRFSPITARTPRASPFPWIGRASNPALMLWEKLGESESPVEGRMIALTVSWGVVVGLPPRNSRAWRPSSALLVAAEAGCWKSVIGVTVLEAICRL